MLWKTKPDSENPESAGKLRLILILAGAAVGIALLLLGSGNWLKTADDKNEQPASPSSQEEIKQYKKELEQQIRELCESVNGVSGVTVVVTLSGGFEEIYATELVNGNEEYVILGSGSNASALHLLRSSPEIAGVGVVCRGGGNANIRQELTSLLCAAYRISSNRIYIAEAKN